MWVWVDRAGFVLFDAAFSTTILLSLVALAMLVSRQPSVRRQIARMALVASLTMIPLVAIAPMPRLDVLGTFLQPDNLVRDSLAVATSAASTSHGLRAGVPGTDGKISEPVPTRAFPSAIWLARGLVVLDLACTTVSLSSLLLGFWGIRWILRFSREPSRSTQDLYDHLVSGAVSRHHWPAALRVSPRVQRPVLVGILRPTILIPPSYDEPGAGVEPLMLSLRHEIAHHEQSDPWFGVVANLAQSVWFLLPPVWWLRTRLLIDQEFLADRAAALQYGTSSEYAASLLTLAESQHVSVAAARADASRAVWPPAQTTGANSPLFQRMLMLLDCPFQVEPRVSLTRSWTLRLAVIGVAIAAASVSIHWPGAAALEHWREADVAPASQPFRVADFVAEPLVFLPGGRALPYIMPVSLPPRFELTVEVLSSITGLANVYIAGQPLASVPIKPLVATLAGDSTDHVESWHQIRLERNGSVLALWVDGRKISIELDPATTSELLTFEPSPRRAAHFRNLVVDW